MNAVPWDGRFMIWLNGFLSLPDGTIKQISETSWMSDTATVKRHRMGLP